MSAQPVPEGFHTLTPYLLVSGVPKLIEFLSAAFGGTLQHRSNAPDGSVMHAQVKVGDSMVMMGEAREEWQPMPTMLYMYVPDVDAVYASALEAGATSVQEPRDEFYGDRTSGVKGPCGNLWWIATHQEDVCAEDIEKRAAARKGGA